MRSLPLPVRMAIDRYIALGLRKVAAEQGGPPLPAAARLRVPGPRPDDRHHHPPATRPRPGPRPGHRGGADPPEPHPLVPRHRTAHRRALRPDRGLRADHRQPADRNRIGTVGPALPGVSVRLGDDGEILVKGGNVCLGYFNDPQATAALLDADGWMHSGDTGAFDPDGYLRIVGRKKDLIITAAGQNVAPQGIESDLRNHPLISEAVVVGDGRRYLTALITLDPEALGRWAQEHDKLVELEALAGDPDLLHEIQAAVDEVNQRGRTPRASASSGSSPTTSRWRTGSSRPRSRSGATSSTTTTRRSSTSSTPTAEGRPQVPVPSRPRLWTRLSDGGGCWHAADR